MNLQQRIDLLVQLGEYIKSNDDEWQLVKDRAYRNNPWFIAEFIELATENIADQFLNRAKLEKWIAKYELPEENNDPKNVGVVMAGNIPLVGFQDFLCVFISGHQITVKPSSKDEVLLKHLVQKLYEWQVTVQNMVSFAEMLKGCDAYIATGSNNSGRYFEYYFNKYPSIIRKNRTSVAILDGAETAADLDKLADDIQLYFGLGCRNVTKLYVPEGYDFIPLLQALKKYEHFMEFHKYKHNFDYQLALQIMNGHFYMNGGDLLLTENTSVFSAVSKVNYEYYKQRKGILKSLENSADIQCIVGDGLIAFGQAQHPSLNDYADGVDMIEFLKKL